MTSRFVCGVVTCGMETVLYGIMPHRRPVIVKVTVLATDVPTSPHLGFAEIYDVRDKWHGYFTLVSILYVN